MARRDHRQLQAEHPALAAVAVRAGTATTSQRQQLLAALGATGAVLQADGGQAGAQPAGTGTPSPAPTPAAPPAQAGAPTPEPGDRPAPRPEVLPAVAGAAAPERDELVQVLYEPSVYGEASGHSMVRDAFRANVDHDAEAAGRLAKFGAEVRHLHAAATRRRQATAAVAVRSGFGEIIPPGYRGDLLISPVDPGRPLVSHLGSIPLSDATPFRIPIEREFEGVGEHTEGQAHVPEGTMDVDEVTVNPSSVSGAFRVSREMVDSSSPALDTMAISAMRRDYNRKQEAKALAALTAVTGAGAALPAVAPGDAFESVMQDFVEVNEGELFAVGGLQLRKALAAEEVNDGRKRYPYLGPSNASGSTSAVFRGIDVQGLPVLKAPVVAANDGWLVDPDAVFWGESSLLLFRFDEVEGPGVIKLALWAYSVCKVTRGPGVKRVTRATA